MSFLIGMIMGAAVSTVHYNLKLRHPTLNMPIIDYDLAVLIQPMLLLGSSIGVIFNLVFAEWMVTLLLIIIFLGNQLAYDNLFVICHAIVQLVLLYVMFSGTSTKAFLKAVETWMKESVVKKVTIDLIKRFGAFRMYSSHT